MADLILKHVMKNEGKEDIFHTSAYGKAQNGSAMGAGSAQSFAKRQEIAGNRAHIQGYGSSKIATQGMSQGPRPKTFSAQASANPQAASGRPVATGGRR